MAQVRSSFAIRINPEDPARSAIAEDLAACGGMVVEESALIYVFRTAGRRDEALRTLRGSFGTRSVEEVADPPPGAAWQATPWTVPSEEEASPSPERCRGFGRGARKNGERGASLTVSLATALPLLAPKLP